MSEAADFIDAALQREATGGWVDGDHRFYGTSVGAVRGTIRDAEGKFPGMTHDDIVILASELWSVPVFERRLAAVVLLQAHVQVLDNGDLTRIEGFVRTSGLAALVDPLTVDVIRPICARLTGRAFEKATAVLGRWARDDDEWVRRAAS